MSGFYEDERIRHKNNKFADALYPKKDESIQEPKEETTRERTPFYKWEDYE